MTGFPRGFYQAVLLAAGLLFLPVCFADAAQTVQVLDGKTASAEISKINDSITVDSGWVRASMPGAGNSVAFLTVKNNSSQEQTIVGVQCQVAKFCELHQHTHSDGQMRMEKVEQLQVPANSTLALSSGGYHIMLLELLEPLKPGAEVKLVLLLADQSTYAFSLPVKSVHDE